MAISVNAVHVNGRKKPVGPAALQQRRQRLRDSRGRLSQTREVAEASPLLRLRASEGRLAKPNLRRKRVATMRSVDGWVRESDPASTRRQVSLDRRMVALRKRGSQKPREKRKPSRPLGNSDGTRRDSSFDGGSTFLTELEAERDGAPRVSETRLRRGGEGVGSWVNGRDAPRRRSTVKTNSARQYPRGSDPRVGRRHQACRRTSGAERVLPSTAIRTRGATVSARIPGRSRSEGTRLKVKVGRTNSVGALHRYGEQQPSPGRNFQSSVKDGVGERGQENRAGLAPAPTQAPTEPPGLSKELNAVRLDTGHSADWTVGHPGGAWDSPSPGRTTDYGVAPVRQDNHTALVATCKSEPNAVLASPVVPGSIA